MPSRGRARGLTASLVAGAVLVALAAAVVVGLLLRSAGALDDAQRRTLRTERVLTQAARAERATLDLETGLRGYLLTGERRFLEPFRRAQDTAPRSLARLARGAENAPQRARARDLARQVDGYLRDYALPLVAPGGLPSNGDETVAVAEEGKRRFDALRAGFAAFDAVERERLERRAAAASARTDEAVAAGVLALVLLLALVTGFALYVFRTVVRPVREVAAPVERVRGGGRAARLEAAGPPQGGRRGGDLEARLDPAGPREVAGLGASMNALGRTLAENEAQLEASNAELRRLSDRNLVVLDSVFSQTPAGLALLDLELRYVRVNAALAAIHGAAPERLLGRRVDETLPGFPPELREALDAVLRTGSAQPEVEVSGRTPADPGTTREWSVRFYPVREHGSVIGVGAVVLDITERLRVQAEREAALERERAARERADFLADASVVLDAPFDVDATLAALGELCVPRLADWCAFDLLEPDGRLRTAAVSHADASKAAEVEAVQRDFPPDPQAVTGAPQVVRTGRSERYPEITPELILSSVPDPVRAQRLLELGLSSVLIVPLTARGRTFGAITLMAAESARHYSADDETVALELGRRAAVALDNARLYRERTREAQTLQASLLPEVLPQIPGIAIAARYEPLGAETTVGGDFYDVFGLGEDRWAVVVGDVCGKGAEAAALTALARYTLRAVAPQPPVQALRALNDAILRQRDDLRFITLVYAELDLRGARPEVRLASGGHPPALLLHPEGPGEVLTCPGTLIGVTPEPALQECRRTLGPGDTVALYTDGVMEANHATPLDGDGLLAALGPRRSADAVADGLQGLARADGASARDDVAILTLQVA